MAMTSKLSTDQLTQITPLLGSVARLVASGSGLSDNELFILLIGIDMETEPNAMEELKRWGRLLTTIKGQPTEGNQHAVQEALVTRGLPEATVILAIETVVNSITRASAIPIRGVHSRLKVNVDRLDFDNLTHSSSAIREIEIEGGPGKVIVENDQISVAPTEFGEDPTCIRVEVKPLSGGLLWTSLKLISANDAVEIPIIAQWQEPVAEIVIPANDQPKAVQNPSILQVKDINISTPLEWESDEHWVERELLGHTDSCESIDFSPDGRFIVSGSGDNTGRIWDITSCKEIAQLEGHTDAVFTVAFSPDGRYIATGSLDKTIIIWSGDKGEMLFQKRANVGGIYSMAFSPNGAYLVIGGDSSSIQIWESSSMKQLYRQKAFYQRKVYARYVNTIVFSPENTFFATGGNEPRVRLWEVSSGNLLSSFSCKGNEIYCLAISPNVKYLACGSTDGLIQIWDIKTGRGSLLQGHFVNVMSILFSPSGRFLVSGSEDGYIHIWDINKQREVLNKRVSDSAISCLSYNSRGPYLAGACSDGTIYLWRLSKLS
jgi:hypothetical protein